MHYIYSASILHRYVLLRKEYIIVYTLRDSNIDICKAKSVKDLDYDNITFYLLYFNSKSLFQAYKYNSSMKTRKLLLDIEFLYQLRSFLVKNYFADLIAILAEDNCQNSVKFFLLDKQAIIYILYKDVYSRINIEKFVITS
jgi:hypothetical protein